MSERSYHDPQTQGIKHITYNVAVLPNGTTGPTLGEGDPNGNWSYPIQAGGTAPTGPWQGSFMSVFRGMSGVTGATGVTGTYGVQTNDPFYKVVDYFAQVRLVTPVGNYTVMFGEPVQQPNNTWILWFTVYNNGVATDLPLTSKVCCQFVFRNSLTPP